VKRIPKQHGKIFNSEAGRTSEKRKIESIEHNNVEFKSEIDIANCMCSYYSTIVDEIIAVHREEPTESHDEDCPVSINDIDTKPI